MEDFQVLINSQAPRIQACGNSIVKTLENLNLEVDHTVIARAKRAITAAINNEASSESLRVLAARINKGLGVSRWKINTGVGLMVGGLGLFAGAVVETARNNFSWAQVLLWMAAPTVEMLGVSLWAWGSPAAKTYFCTLGRATIESDLYMLSHQLLQLDKELNAVQRQNDATPLYDSGKLR